MRTFLKLILGATIALTLCSAQQPSDTEKNIQLNDIKSPSSPAFTILGTQPTEIARPSTYNALVAGLYSSFTDQNNFILPKNYALEFTPYWMTSHPVLTYDQYVNPTVDQSILQSSSISLATNETTDQIDTTKKYTRMGIGYRTLIYNGSLDASNKTYIDNMKKLQTYQKIRAVINGILNRIRANKKITSKEEILDTLNSLYDKKSSAPMLSEQEKSTFQQFRKEEMDDYLKTDLPGEKTMLLQNLKDHFISMTDTTLSESAEAIEESSNRRVGFILEFAAAIELDFPSNQFDNSKVTKFGIWLTPTYRLVNPSLDISIVLRYMQNKSTEIINNDYTDNLDYGIGLTYDQNSFSLSGELIGRNQSVTLSRTKVGNDYITTTKSRTDIRYSFTLEYKLSASIVLSYSLGKNFDQYTEYSSNLISQITASYNIGNLTKNNVLP